MHWRVYICPSLHTNAIRDISRCVHGAPAAPAPTRPRPRAALLANPVMHTPVPVRPLHPKPPSSWPAPHEPTPKRGPRPGSPGSARANQFAVRPAPDGFSPPQGPKLILVAWVLALGARCTTRAGRLSLSRSQFRQVEPFGERSGGRRRRRRRRQRMRRRPFRLAAVRIRRPGGGCRS